MQEANHVEDEPIFKFASFSEECLARHSRDHISRLIVTRQQQLLVGTQSGTFYVYSPKGTVIRQVRVHSAPITDISIDKQSAYVATSSIDGTVVIQSFDGKEKSAWTFKRPVRSVTIEPDYGQVANRKFASGGTAGDLMISEKGWLGTKDTVAAAQLGVIFRVSWKGDFIACASEQGVSVLHVSTMKIIGQLEATASTTYSGLNPTTLVWKDGTTIHCSQDNTISILRIVDADRSPKLQVQKLMKFDCIICGFTLSDANTVILGYPWDSSTRKTKPGETPGLRVINAEDEEESDDNVVAKDMPRLRPNDYFIAHSSESLLFVSTPNEILSAQKRTNDDHLEWALMHHDYDRALDLAESDGETLDLGFFEVAELYLQDLMKQGWCRHSKCWLMTGKYNEAGRISNRLLKEDAPLWEKWISIFSTHEHLQDIADFVPRRADFLKPDTYKSILLLYLHTNTLKFKTSIEEWDPNIFETQSIIDAIRIATDDFPPKDPNLNESLAELFLRSNAPEDAIFCFLSLKNEKAADIVEQYHLYKAFRDQVVEFLSLTNKSASPPNEAEPNKKALKILIDHTRAIPITAVMAQLDGHSYLQFRYLQELYHFDPLVSHHFTDIQLERFARYSRTDFAKYLTDSSDYSLDTAARICREHGYLDELVLVLDKMGDFPRALSIIVEGMGDVQKAVNFVVRHGNDSELWNYVLKLSVTKPSFIKGLLEMTSSEVDPLKVLANIQPGIVIPDLKQSLLKVFNDYELQLSLAYGCHRIFSRNVQSLSHVLQRLQKVGVSISIDRVCDICHIPVSELSATDDIIKFNNDDGKLYHAQCLLDKNHAPPDLLRALIVRSVPEDSNRAGSITDKVTKAALMQPFLSEYMSE